MCLAIAHPAGVTIPADHFREAFSSNSDGAGFAYWDGSSVVIKKGFFKAKKLIKAYMKEAAGKPCLIHFRYATHGNITVANCHPFRLTSGAAAIHNGVLDYTSSVEKSDTSHFCDEILSPLLAVLPADCQAVRHLVEETIGAGNKIAVLSNGGDIVIYNEKRGHWFGGAWFSNDSYKFRASVYEQYYSSMMSEGGGSGVDSRLPFVYRTTIKDASTLPVIKGVSVRASDKYWKKEALTCQWCSCVVDKSSGQQVIGDDGWLCEFCASDPSTVDYINACAESEGGAL